jgi:mannose-6-phosphate isomerase-like protein (cupin superfamily)
MDWPFFSRRYAPLASSRTIDFMAEENVAEYVVVERDQLPDAELEGYLYGGAKVCVIFIDLEPGGGPRLHRHPYDEIFILLEGIATFTIGAGSVQANAGQVLIAKAGAAHKFVNSGEGRLRQIDIHASDRFVTEWLVEPDR